MSNIPAGLGNDLSYVVLAIIFGTIIIAAVTFLYYRRKWKVANQVKQIAALAIVVLIVVAYLAYHYTSRLLA